MTTSLRKPHFACASEYSFCASRYDRGVLGGGINAEDVGVELNPKYRSRWCWSLPSWSVLMVVSFPPQSGATLISPLPLPPLPHRSCHCCCSSLPVRSLFGGSTPLLRLIDSGLARFAWHVVLEDPWWWSGGGSGGGGGRGGGGMLLFSNCRSRRFGRSPGREVPGWVEGLFSIKVNPHCPVYFFACARTYGSRCDVQSRVLSGGNFCHVRPRVACSSSVRVLADLFNIGTPWRQDAYKSVPRCPDTF